MVSSLASRLSLVSSPAVLAVIRPDDPAWRPVHWHDAPLSGTVLVTQREESELAAEHLAKVHNMRRMGADYRGRWAILLPADVPCGSDVNRCLAMFAPAN